MTYEIPWRRVFVEGAVIVVSILLAFTIDAWWAQRQNHALEIHYLGRLSADFAEGATQLNAQLERLGNATPAARELADALDGPVQGIADDTLVDLFAIAARTGFIEANLDHSATYRELQTTGRLALIQDRDLLEGLAGYYRGVELLIQSLLELNQGASVRFMQLTGRRPIEIQNAPGLMTAEVRQRMVAELRGNAEVVRELRQFTAMVTLNLGRLEDYRERNAELASRLALAGAW
jgi:hypothetical protein